MKELKSRYSLNKVNEKYYETLKITGDNTGNNPNIVYIPYKIVTKSEDDEKTKSDIEYDNFMKEYDNKHKLCPNCKSENYTTTLVGYILNMDKKEDYKDLNTCVCVDCKNVHSAHDRIAE